MQIGSVREGSTAEEEADFMAGLRQTLNQLRAHKVKDFSTVLAEIVAYRSKFLKDESRVLILTNPKQIQGQVPPSTG